MGLSKRSRQGIQVFNRIRQSVHQIKYLMPTTDAHDEALKANARFDIEKAQKEARLCRIRNLKN